MVTPLSLRVSERKVWSSKLYTYTTGIRQEGHPEFKVLRCSNKLKIWLVIQNLKVTESRSLSEILQKSISE